LNSNTKANHNLNASMPRDIPNVFVRILPMTNVYTRNCNSPFPSTKTIVAFS